MKKIVYIFLLITSFVFSQELIKESDVYFKDGKVAAATSSIQNRQQITTILDRSFGNA